MLYLDILEITTVLSLISASSERVVELIKPLIKVKEDYKTSVYSALAILASGLIYTISNLHIINTGNIYSETLLIALASSAGAGFWHNALEVVKALKYKAG